MNDVVTYISEFLRYLFGPLEDMMNMCGSLLMAEGLIDGLLGNDSYTGMLYNIANTIKPVAYTIVSICFVIEFIKITAEANVLKWEYGLRVFAKLVLARVCIDVAPLALNTIYTTFVSWVTISEATLNFDMTNLLTELENEMLNLNFFSLFGWLLSVGLLYVTFMILNILCAIICYARVFELAIYFAISPIPCALMPLSDGTGSRITKKFFMSFAATCMSGLLMVICMRIYCSVFMSYTVNVTARSIRNLFVTEADQIMGIMVFEVIALIMLFIAMTKCNSWAKTIMDVG